MKLLIAQLSFGWLHDVGLHCTHLGFHGRAALGSDDALRLHQVLGLARVGGQFEELLWGEHACWPALAERSRLVEDFRPVQHHPSPVARSEQEEDRDRNRVLESSHAIRDEVALPAVRREDVRRRDHVTQPP